MNLLVDADILVFRMCHAHETITDWGDGVESHDVDEYVAKGRIKRLVQNYVARTKCDTVKMCLTSPKNFRYKVYPEYKANRVSQHWHLFPILLDWLPIRYECVRMDYLEADDVMGILSTQEPGKHMIATIDKDLNQIPGWHFNWGKDTNVPYGVSDYDGTRLFYKQILCGDTVDNYKGVPGIGPVKAEAILDGAELMIDCVDDNGLPSIDDLNAAWWSAVKMTYDAKGLCDEYLMQMARVARICRASDFNTETGEPILWSPKESPNG